MFAYCNNCPVCSSDERATLPNYCLMKADGRESSNVKPIKISGVVSVKEKTSLGTKITREYKYTITQVDYVSRRATVCRGGDYYNCSKVESDLHISYGGKATLWGYELGDMGNGKSSAYFSFDDSSYDGNNGFISKTVTVKIEVYGGWISSRESIYGNSLAADMAVAIGDCISNCGTIGDLSFIGLNPWLAVMR